MKTNPSDKMAEVSADNSNDGFVNRKAARGQTIIQAYGKDVSSLKGSSDGERGREMKNTGLSKSMNAYE